MASAAQTQNAKEAIVCGRENLVLNRDTVHPAEAAKCPVDGILVLHQIPDTVRCVRGAAMPALRVLQVDISRFTEDGDRRLALELGIFLAVRMFA